MDLIYRLYGLLHRLAKFVISRGKYEKGAKIYLNNKIELGVSSDKAKHNWMHFMLCRQGREIDIIIRIA